MFNAIKIYGEPQGIIQMIFAVVAFAFFITAFTMRMIKKYNGKTIITVMDFMASLFLFLAVAPSCTHAEHIFYMDNEQVQFDFMSTFNFVLFLVSLLILTQTIIALIRRKKQQLLDYYFFFFNAR